MPLKTVKRKSAPKHPGSFPAPDARPLMVVDFDNAMERVAKLERDHAELKGDFRRLAELLSEQFNEPFRTRANEIIKKHQGE